MGDLIRFFASDLSGMFFPPEKADTVSGYSKTPYASASAAWAQDAANMRRDAQRAVNRVMYEKKEKELA